MRKIYDISKKRKKKKKKKKKETKMQNEEINQSIKWWREKEEKIKETEKGKTGCTYAI